MEKIVAFLDLQKQIRDVKNMSDLAFLAANKTHDIISYKHAVFWTWDGTSVQLDTISGMATLDRNSPYAIWLKSFIEKELKISKDKIEFFEKEEEGEWIAIHNHLIRFETQTDGLIGGLWIESDSLFSDGQIELLSEIADCYTQAVSLIHLRSQKKAVFSIFGMGKYKKYTAIALLAAFFFPVRLSITAPAEIVAMDAVSITMPYDGVLEKINVDPSTTISEGDILAVMDKTAIQTELDQAKQALKTVQSSLSRAGMESLRTEDKKQDLQALRAEIAAKRIDFNYAQDRFKNTDIASPVSGVAIFSDKSSLEGRALRTGEKIMTVADPSKQQLLVRIPVQSLLPIDKGQALSFFVTTQPFTGYDATISSIGYEPSADPDGLLTYKIRAKLGKEQQDLRIGWQGTAKIKSNWSIWGYALLRRPLIALRNLLGV